MDLKAAVQPPPRPACLNDAALILPNPVPDLPDPEAALRAALRRPISGKPLAERVPPTGDVVVILPDRARPTTPTAMMLRAVLDELAGPLGGRWERVLLLIGTGTHRPHAMEASALPEGMPAGIRSACHVAVAHDELIRIGRIPARLHWFVWFAGILLWDALRHLPSTAVDLARALVRADGTELRRLLGYGLPLRLVLAAMAAWGPYPRMNRRVVEAGLVIAIGRVKPHPFTGYAGGVKGIWPAAAGRVDAGLNHLLQLHPHTRPGRVRGNPLLADLETIVSHLGNAMVVNLVSGPNGAPAGFFAGDPIPAHRAASALARDVALVPAHPADLVVIGNREQGRLDLFQYIKSLVQAGRMARPGGAVVCCGELAYGASGTGDPHTRPNFAIKEVVYHLGIRPAIARDVAFWLASPNAFEIARGSFFRPAASLEDALAAARRRVGPSARVAWVPDIDSVIPVLDGDRPGEWL